MENLKKIVNSDAAYEILDSSNCAGSTWTSGGCAILAQALNKLEGYPIYVIYNTKFKSSEHFGVMTPNGSILDADGEHKSKEAWINFFKKNEMSRPGDLIVIPFKSGVEIEGVNFDEEASNRLAELIRGHKMIRETVRGFLKHNLINEKLVLKDYSNYIELVSNAYQNSKSYDNSAIKHWESLNKSNYSLFKRLLSKVNLVFTTNDKKNIGKININNRDFNVEYILPGDEYKTQSEMKNSFKDTGILKISIDYSKHPYFSVIDNIVFRTVHDYIAHILGDYDFGAKGEIACYNLHKKMAPNEAIPALFTEVVGQVSVTIVTGSFPEQKITLLEGFDYHNIGVVDDENYEIIDKVLVKKGDEIKKDKIINRDEPEAIHAYDSIKQLELAHMTIVRETVRGILSKSIINEFLTNDEVELKQYLSMSDENKKLYLPHEFSYFFNDFLEEEMIDFTSPKKLVPSNYADEPDVEEDMFDSDFELITWLENNNKELYDTFAEYLLKKIKDDTLPIPEAEYPAWSYFDDSPELVKNQWLIHFTNNADDIAREGFRFGANDMTKLGLTTSIGEFDKKYGGYNFAYLLSDFPKYSRRSYVQGGGYKYGKEAVIFNASGIKVWHYGDQEPQVIFYGNTATNIVPITKGENYEWAIRGKDGKVLFENDDLQRIVKWLTNNYSQYRKQLNESIKTEAFDGEYKSWKRKNVTIRGVKEIGEENDAGAMLGQGLYTAALSNKDLAKQYGKVYFVLGAIPKNPKVFNTLNHWQIWFYNTLVYKFSKEKGKEFPDKRDFNASTTIEDEMQKLGYDGIVIKGREMVNFTPGDVLYFENENQLYDYYDYNIRLSEVRRIVRSILR